MNVEELIKALSEYPPHIEVQLLIIGTLGDSTRYSIDRIKRGQEGPEHFVGIEA